MNLKSLKSFIARSETSIPSCSPIDFSWIGGTPPYYATFQPSDGSLPFLVVYSILTQNITLQLNYPAGTTVGWSVHDANTTAGSGNFVISDSGSTSCYAQSSINADTSAGDPEFLLTWQGLTNGTTRPVFDVSSCSPITIALQNGSPPFSVNFTDFRAQPEVAWQISIDAYNFTIPLAFPTGTRYSVSISDGVNTISSGGQTVSQGGTTDCLLSTNNFQATGSNNPSFSVSFLSNSSNTPALIGGIVGGIVGLLLLGVVTVLLLRRRKQKMRKAKRAKLTSIVAQAPYNFQASDDVNPTAPQEDNEIPLSPISPQKKRGSDGPWSTKEGSP